MSIPMSVAHLLYLPLEIRHMIWRHAISSSEDSYFPMPVVGFVRDGRSIDHQWRVGDIDKSRNQGILCLFLSCRQIVEQAQSVFYSECTLHFPISLHNFVDGAYRSFKISALRLELAFGGLPQENLKLIQHCAVIMEIDIDLDRCDLSDKWACVCSSLPHIMDELLDKVPKLKHLTLALCIQNNSFTSARLFQEGCHA